MDQSRVVSIAKPCVFVAALVPFVALAYGLATDNLGANPVEMITHESGEWALRLLLLTLLVTPARRLTGWAALLRLRRMLGLFAFFYVSVHFLTYAVLDAGLDVAYVLEDILERPYITVGFTALCMLVPLAITSTNGMVRRLGGARWRKLHRLVYLASGGAVLHFLWLGQGGPDGTAGLCGDSRNPAGHAPAARGEVAISAQADGARGHARNPDVRNRPGRVVAASPLRSRYIARTRPGDSAWQESTLRRRTSSCFDGPLAECVPWTERLRSRSQNRSQNRSGRRRSGRGCAGMHAPKRHPTRMRRRASD